MSQPASDFAKTSKSGLSQHLRRIAALAWPMMIGQMAIVGNGVIDTAMTSRFSATDLAALSIGISIYVSIFVGLNGVLQAISPQVGQLFGAGNLRQIGAEVKQGMWLGVFLSIIGCLLLLFPQALLGIAQAPPRFKRKSITVFTNTRSGLTCDHGFQDLRCLKQCHRSP